MYSYENIGLEAMKIRISSANVILGPILKSWR